METRKKTLLHIRLIRRIVQLTAFILFPGLFILAFSAIGALYKAVIGGSFSISALSLPLLILLAVIPVTILWGRFFCGFLCAFGSMGDFFWSVSRRLFKIRFIISEKADRILKLLKYVVLLLIVIVIWTLAFPIDSTINPWTIFGMYASVTAWPSASYLLSIGTLLLLLIICGSMLVERFFCRYFCPLGAIFTLISRLRLFRIKKPRSNCGSCKLCTRKCSMGIALYQEDRISSGECIDCFSCVEVCPRHNISTNPTPSVSAAITVVAMTGLYYAGSLIPENINDSGNSIVSSVNSAGQGQYEDGEYTGSASGYKGVTTVQVTVKNGCITDITILSTNDDNEFFSKARNSLIREILSSQSTQVDIVTGATFSSNAIINAVNNALGLASEGTRTSQQEITSEMQSSAPAETSDGTLEAAVAPSTTSYTNGVFSGSGTGFRGETAVSVTVNNEKITEITVESYQDDAPYFNQAKDTILASIMKEQSIDVDAVTGATFSSNGILAAVADALDISFENPNNTAEKHGHKGFFQGGPKDP